MSGHKSFCLQTNVKSMRTASQSGGGLAWQFYAGINLTGYHPPGAFALSVNFKTPNSRYKLSIGVFIFLNCRIHSILF